MRGRGPLALPTLFALAIALAPAAQACHIGPGLAFSTGVVVTPMGPTVAALAMDRLCEGPVTLQVLYQSPIGGGRESILANLDILAPDADCVALSCGGSDPLAAALRFTAPEAGLDLVGAFEYPHATAGFALAGTVHGLPAAFAASAV